MIYIKKIVLKIDGMTCSACSNGLEKYLKRQAGIIDVNVNLILAIATIAYENIKIKDIENYIKEAGFKSLGEFKTFDDNNTFKKEKKLLIIYGILLIILMYITMSHMLSLPNLDNYPKIYALILILFSLIFLVYGFDIIKNGFKNLIHQIPNMDTLVTFSVTFSLIYSFYGVFKIFNNELSYLHNLYFESACMVIYFIKLGRFIENISKDKTKDAIKSLVQITPQYAIIKKNNKEIKITIDEVKVDDILICHPGEKIAVDGIVISGKTYVNESFITGESKPVLKEKKSNVIAGSINYDGVITYKAKKIGRDSTISEIVKMAVEATNSKTKIQRIADKVSGIFVPIIFIIALITLLIHLLIGHSFNLSLNYFVTVLVVACPCALGLAVPLVIVISNGKCAKNGLFLKKAEVIENAKDIDTVVFDKTGTLTYGKLKINKFFNYSDITDKQLLKIVSSLEANSSHPIATAFSKNNLLKVSDFKNIVGMGIFGQIKTKEYYVGNLKLLEKLKIKDNHISDYNFLTEQGCSILYVVSNQKVIGLIGVKDIIRNNSKELVKNLKNNKINVIMLTGDNAKTAKLIAKELGITEIIADVLPNKKADFIKSLIKDNKKVLMIGDGINDAVALVNATIGVSISDGTDVAVDSSDVILMNNDLNNIIKLLKISQKAFKIIKQNLFWAFFYNLIMIPLAAGLLSPLGIVMNPMIASLAMTLSSLTVVFNSLRLKGEKDA